MANRTTQKNGHKDPNEPESIYTLRQQMRMRSLRKAKFSKKQIVTEMDGRVTASAIGAAVRKGGAIRHLTDSEILEISKKVGEPRGPQLL